MTIKFMVFELKPIGYVEMQFAKLLYLIPWIATQCIALNKTALTNMSQ